MFSTYRGLESALMALENSKNVILQTRSWFQGRTRPLLEVMVFVCQALGLRAGLAKRPRFCKHNKKTVLSQEELRDAAVNFDSIEFYNGAVFLLDFV